MCVRVHAHLYSGDWVCVCVCMEGRKSVKNVAAGLSSMRRSVCRGWLCCRFLLSDTLFFRTEPPVPLAGPEVGKQRTSALNLCECVYECAYTYSFTCMHTHTYVCVYIDVRYPFYASLHWNFFFAFFSSSSKRQHLRSSALYLTHSLLFSSNSFSLRVHICISSSLYASRLLFLAVFWLPPTGTAAASLPTSTACVCLCLCVCFQVYGSTWSSWRKLVVPLCGLRMEESDMVTWSKANALLLLLCCWHSVAAADVSVAVAIGVSCVVNVAIVVYVILNAPGDRS